MPTVRHINDQCGCRAAEIAFSATLQASTLHAKDIDALFPSLVDARRSLGIFQHHDGVTGTAKTLVMKDYGQKFVKRSCSNQNMYNSLETLRLYQAVGDCQSIIANCLAYLLSSNSSAPKGGASLKFVSILFNCMYIYVPTVIDLYLIWRLSNGQMPNHCRKSILWQFHWLARALGGEGQKKLWL